MPVGVPAWTPLANYTVSGSSTTTVTFSSISGIYRDLVLVVAGSNSSTTYLGLRLNSDTGFNYYYNWVSGNGSSASSNQNSTNGIYFLSNAQIGTTQGLYKFELFDYADSNKHKTIFAKADKADAATDSFVYRWNQTSAITSIQAVVLGGNLVAGTTLCLYGVSA